MFRWNPSKQDFERKFFQNQITKKEITSRENNIKIAKNIFILTFFMQVNEKKNNEKLRKKSYCMKKEKFFL